MKKKNIAHIGTCSAILALLFGAGALSLHTNAALRGDINEDGKINANDYIALRRALLAGESLPSKTADVNDDGKINAADYIALRMHLLGLRPITQPEERFVRTPISLGCKYAVSGTIGENYQDTYGSELTDGSYAISATYFDTEYVGFQRDNSDAAITVDLGSTRDGINGFEFSFLSTNSAGIMPPASVSVSVSADGKSWTSLGNMKLNTSPIMAADKATLDLECRRRRKVCEVFLHAPRIMGVCGRGVRVRNAARRRRIHRYGRRQKRLRQRHHRSRTKRRAEQRKNDRTRIV